MRRVVHLFLFLMFISCQKNDRIPPLGFEVADGDVGQTGNIAPQVTKEEALKIIEVIWQKYPERWIDISRDVVPAGSYIEYNNWGVKTSSSDALTYISPEYDSWLLVVGPDTNINGPQRLLHVFLNVITGDCMEVWLDGRAIVEWDISRNNYVDNKEELLVQARSMSQISESSSNKWAVIISGGYNVYNNYARYWNDCQYVYLALTQELDYSKNQIFCLVSDGTNPEYDRRIGNNTYDSSPLDFDGDNVADINYSATKSNISTVFNLLSSAVSVGDEVLVFVTDHGDLCEDSGMGLVLLWNNETLSAVELNAELNKLGGNVNVDVVMGQCYSGAFIPNVKGDNRTIVTASRADEVSFGSGINGYDYFLRKWTDAIYDINPTLSGVVSNGDGYLSSFEMFQYAKTEPKALSGDEHPQINEGPNLFSWGHDLQGNSFLPEISGSDYASTNSPSYYSVSGISPTYPCTWSCSGDIRMMSSNNSSATIIGNIATSSQFLSVGAEVFLSFSDLGESFQVLKQIKTVWKPGLYINTNQIKGGDGIYYVGAYNWDGVYGFCWECGASDWEIMGQYDGGPYHYVYISEGSKMAPVPLMVSFYEPLGGMISIVDYLY